MVGLVTSCDDDDEISNPENSILAVPEDEITIFEDEEVDIFVRFSKRPVETGTIGVSFNGSAIYGQDFTTEPEGTTEGVSIPVSSGDDGASLRIISIIEPGLNLSKTVSLNFESEGGLSFGTQNSSELVIVNRPEINFPGSQGLENFGEVVELETSEAQTLELSVVGLLDDLNIEASDNYEISFNDEDFSSTLSITAEAINNADTTVYIRFAPQFDALNTQTGTITFFSTNANDVVFNMEGSGTPQPPTVFSDLSSITFGSTAQGGFSPSQAVIITGYRLTENVSVIAPENFEVSTNDIDFSNSANLPFEDINALNEVALYVRFAPNTGIDGPKTDDLILSSSGLSDVIISLTGEEGLGVIAYTSFEEPEGLDIDYVDTGDPAINRTLQNNMGEAPVQYAGGDELGFNTIYIFTGGQGATDGDDLGVTTKSSIVGDTPEGGYTDGVQGYYADDTDGIIQIVFQEVDITGLTTLRVRMDYLFNDTTWEIDDIIKATLLTQEGVPLTLLSLTGEDIENLGLDPEPHIWNNLDVDVSSLAGTTASVQLVIEVQTESGAEEVYFDNIRFLGN